MRSLHTSRRLGAALAAGLCLLVEPGIAEAAPSPSPEPASSGASGAAPPAGRLLPGVLEIDLASGGMVRGWIPQGYPTLDISTEGYATWFADLSVNIGDLFRIHRAYYESNGLVPPTSTSATLADASQGSSLAYALLLLMGGLKLGRSSDWEIAVRHTREVFRITVTPTQPTHFVAYDSVGAGHADISTLPLVTSPISSVTAFESTSVGAMVELGKNSPIGGEGFLGLAYTRYQKPYMFRFGDTFIPDYLFDARFSGFGIELGAFRKDDPVKGGFFYDAHAQIAGGKVGLTQDLELSKMADPDKAGIGFLQGHLGLGYLLRIVQSTWSLSVGIHGEVTGNYFFTYLKSESDSGASSSSSGKDTTFTLNYDVLFGVDGRIVIGF